MRDRDDLNPLIWICRDIPGEHTGGPDCFCRPYVIDPSDEAAVARMLELADHPERQAPPE